jgi:hypothetical protein
MFHMRFLVYQEMGAIVASQDGDLVFGLGEQLARAAIQAVGDLQKDGDRRNRLVVFDLVDRTRGNPGTISQLLQSQVRLVPPATNSSRNPFEILFHGQILIR